MEFTNQLNDTHALSINQMVEIIKRFNNSQGWHDKYNEVVRCLESVGRSDLVKVVANYRAATMIALIHSELSEALEGMRKNLMDDHLLDRPMVEVEMADVLIRLLDFAATNKLDLGGATLAKDEYNHNRQDHKKENREAIGGKKF